VVGCCEAAAIYKKNAYKKSALKMPFLTGKPISYICAKKVLAAAV
jgi:hypothetical protein